jgi:thiol-disulfide isomerase/thioredoxin
MRKILVFTALLYLIVTACNNASQTTPTSLPSSTAAFVANPQAVQEQPVTPLAIGADAPDFNLPGVDGKMYSLADFKAAKVLAIIFTCNHCPTAQAYENRMIQVAADYKDKSIAFVAISPNSPLGLLYEELGYTDLDDDFESMKIRAKDKGYNFPYLYDGDTESASLKYGPEATPHAFVFDKDRKLRYIGRLDASEKPGKGNSEDLRQALDAMLDGKAVPVPVTKTFGCSTKWAWKTAYKVQVDKEWAAKPIKVAKLDTKGIQKLLKNEATTKLRLINVWATWCGPCMLEYPNFLVLQRMYGARDFEFVSVSADKPDQEAKVLKAMQDKQSAIPNYLFSEDDKYALIEAIDKDWNGALPYTILVEPNGKVVWRHQGDVDFAKLKKVIVDHPMMGRYF